jgi:hypothetical protein
MFPGLLILKFPDILVFMGVCKRTIGISPERTWKLKKGKTFKVKSKYQKK